MLAVASPAASAVTPAPGAIAYQGNGKIYLISSDGTGQRAIVSGAADVSFSWSPDGKRIVFAAGKTRENFTRLRIVTVDQGAKGVQLTPSNLDAQYPYWSEDGKTIVFSAGYAADDGWSIVVIGPDGSGLKKLTDGTHDDLWPAFSPDGRWIVFDRTVTTDASPILWDLMEMHPDGTSLHRLARIAAANLCICADFSPDGSKIAYQAVTDPSNPTAGQIFVMNADGTGRKRLTSGFDNESPDWSPDGTQIAFYSTRNGRAEIYVMNADGSNQTRVTRDTWYSALPRWRPNSAS